MVSASTIGHEDQRTADRRNSGHGGIGAGAGRCRRASGTVDGRRQRPSQELVAIRTHDEGTREELSAERSKPGFQGRRSPGLELVGRLPIEVRTLDPGLIGSLI